MDKNNFEAVERLFETVVALETVEECAAFFEDICTIKEIRDIAQRLQVAEMLHSGKNYQEISQETGASTATICRVNKCLHYGAGGYRAALAKGEKESI
jgi:TrpR-related protein YerC/YecD